MAIIPRTIFSHPRHLMLFLVVVAIFAGAAIGGALAYKTRCHQARPSYASHALKQLEARRAAHQQFSAAYRVHIERMSEQNHIRPAYPARSAFDTSGAPLSRKPGEPACRLTTPEPQWDGAHWARRLGCMELRGEAVDALLDEVDIAIEASGLSVELALKKAEYLERNGEVDAQIDILYQSAVEFGPEDAYGPSDQIARPLLRALLWRGDERDLSLIRELELTFKRASSDDLAAQCLGSQSRIWSQMMRAHHGAQASLSDSQFTTASRARYLKNIRHSIGEYIDQGCAEQVHQGRWDTLAQVAGVAIAAEATNGHDGKSSLLTRISRAYRIRHVPEFCRVAVPDRLDLREICEERINDELFLAGAH